MNKRSTTFSVVISLLFSTFINAQTFSLRAPAYPLITHNPYFSVWSFNDQMNAENTKHWTGKSEPMIGLIKVDGTIYQFMGKSESEYQSILPVSEEKSYDAAFTEMAPTSSSWMQLGFDASKWKKGNAPFSDQDNKGTVWKSHDIWVRRSFKLDKLPKGSLFLDLLHDDNAEVYINGTLVYQHTGWLTEMKKIPIPESALKSLKIGDNVLSIHVANTAGGAMLDAGLSVELPVRASAKIAKQNSVKINATQTQYTFTCGAIDLSLIFTSPLLLHDLDLMARPVSYITFQVKSNDNKLHRVEIMNGISSNLAVNNPSQKVVVKQLASKKLEILSTGTQTQEILKKKGDDVRIDWGYLYVGAKKEDKPFQFISSISDAVPTFSNLKYLGENKAEKRLLNTVFYMGMVGAKMAERTMVIGYDELYAIQYFGTNLRPWWNNDGNKSFLNVLDDASQDYSSTLSKCIQTNDTIYHQALAAGGEDYARLCVLAYRQSIAAHELVKSPNGDILFLSKENFSNGSINTVDITYPSAPMYLLYNTELLKGMLNGIFYYSESGKWTKPFPAHDIGTYPLANGQTYGEDMPVEEAGNLLILSDAIAHADKNANYAQKHWNTLSTWAAYLLKEGFDPTNQLCTDDFAGHLARNANLSIKAIVALAAYADMAKRLGKTDVATLYSDSAKQMAKHWEALAKDGDHYSLAFGAPNTWSQKYNMVWDKIFKYGLFSQEVYTKEVTYYLTQMQKYGLPLDSRKTYTKSDWTIWTATLSDNNADFEKIIAPLYKTYEETPTRVPMSDWYETLDAKQVGFQARSVVSGYFIKILADLNK